MQQAPFLTENQQLQQLTSVLTGQPQQPVREPREHNGEKPDFQKWPTLYVGNLPDKSFFDLDLKKFFESNGFNVKSAMVASDATKSRSLGHGYVSFNNEEDSNRAFTTLNNATIQGKQISLNRVGDFVKNPLANIIVRNLNKSLNQSKVYEYFCQFGKISSCKLNVFEDGTSRGFAYIQYSDPNDAQKAIQALNKKVWEGNTLEIDIHKTKDQRSTTGEIQKFTNLYVQGFGSNTT